MDGTHSSSPAPSLLGDGDRGGWAGEPFTTNAGLGCRANRNHKSTRRVADHHKPAPKSQFWPRTAEGELEQLGGSGYSELVGGLEVRRTEGQRRTGSPAYRETSTDWKSVVPNALPLVTCQTCDEQPGHLHGGRYRSHGGSTRRRRMASSATDHSLFRQCASGRELSLARFTASLGQSQ